MEDQTPTRGKRRIVCLTGSKEGAGKSTVALNLALAWAGTQSRGVVIVHLDPLCRDDLSPQLGLTPPTLAELMRAGTKVTRGGTRPQVPLSQWGVGVLPLAANPEEAKRVFPGEARRELERLSLTYDLFLDVDPCSPLRRMALEISTLTFWTCLPQRAHFDAAEAALGAGGRSGAPMVLVVNQCNMPGALEAEDMTASIRRIPSSDCRWMPHERRIPELTNRGKLVVVEDPHSDWVRALRPLLGHVMES
ncbi:hypothetical protein EPO15_15885 [bacterium]|nr:MAG: hypothetical protein EPO15_15885 [bacterium]